jgi:hypothetical protein
MSLCLVKTRDVQEVDLLNFIEVCIEQVHRQQTVTTDQQK